jgi:hypothetical protein
MGDVSAVLAALKAAAERAAAAGRPLPLEVLRVVGWHEADAFTAGRLVACLPNLHTLQLRVKAVPASSQCRRAEEIVQLKRHLAPLQGATQLQALHLRGPSTMFPSCNAAMARLLPVSLKQLSWEPSVGGGALHLSHLSQLTTLRLKKWHDDSYSSSSLPPGVRQLELDVHQLPLEVLVEQQAKLAALSWHHMSPRLVRQLSGLCNVRTISIIASDLSSLVADGAALAQLPALSAVAVSGYTVTPRALRTLARSVPQLRRLDLAVSSCPVPKGLGKLTGLERLTLGGGGGGTPAQQQTWAAQLAVELGRLTRLRWLTVPCTLVGPSLGPCLGSLQQLRVLVVQWALSDVSCVAWMQGWAPSMLPPRLLLLGVTGTAAACHTAPGQLRRSLQQALGASGCQIVVGVDLDEVGDTDGQLVGWPHMLQQALA